MEDHDQRFKHMLREFFREFMELFFPAWAVRLDFAAVEWLVKELFVDPPQGEKRFLALGADEDACGRTIANDRPRLAAVARMSGESGAEISARGMPSGLRSAERCRKSRTDQFITDTTL